MPMVDDKMVCDDCGKQYDSWFTDSIFWNAVMTPDGVAAMDDPGGLLCDICFRKRAEERFVVVGWKLTPEWNWQHQPPATPVSDREK